MASQSAPSSGLGPQEHEQAWVSLHAAINDSDRTLEILEVTIHPGQKIHVRDVEAAYQRRLAALREVGKTHASDAQKDARRCRDAMVALKEGKTRLNGNGSEKAAEGSGKHSVANAASSTHQAVEAQVPGVVNKEKEKEQPTHTSKSAGSMLNRIGKSRVGIAAAGVAGAAAAVIGWAVTHKQDSQWEKAKIIDSPKSDAVKKVTEAEAKQVEQIKLPPSPTPFDPTKIAAEPRPVVNATPKNVPPKKEVTEEVVPPVAPPPTVVPVVPKPKPVETPAAQTPPKEPKPIEVVHVEPKVTVKPTTAEKPKDARVAVESVESEADKHLDRIRGFQANASKLLESATETSDSTKKYATLVVALERAQKEGGITSARAVLLALRKNFTSEDNFLSREMEAIKAMAKTAKADSLATWAIPCMLHACKQEQHEAAIKLGRSISLPGKLSVRNREASAGARRAIVAATGGATELQKQSRGLDSARQEVGKNPDDPAANEALGRYALNLGETKTALEHLSKAGGILGTLAVKTQEDKRSHMNAEQLFALAQEWAAVPGALNNGGMAHLIVGLLIEAEMKAEGLEGETISEKAAAFGAKYKVPVLLTGGEMDSKRITDYMQWAKKMSAASWEKHSVNVKREMVKAEDGEERIELLLSEGGRLQLPRVRSSKYWIDIEYTPDHTPPNNPDALFVNFSINYTAPNGTSATTDDTFMVGGGSGTVTGMHVNGLAPYDGPNVTRTTMPIRVFNGKKYALRIHVDASGRAPIASVASFFAEKGNEPQPLTAFTGNAASFSPTKKIFPNPGFAVTTFGTKFRIHHISVIHEK